jgi:phosphatidylserine synthase 2
MTEEQPKLLEGDAGAAEELERLNRGARTDPIRYDMYSILMRPRSVTAMMVLGGALTYLALTRDATHTMASNVKLGLFGAWVSFLLFALLQFPDSLFRRPHPLFWRVVMGLGLTYMLILVFLLFQTLDDARKLTALIDPKLGVPLPERNYAVDCRVYTPEDPQSMFRNVRDAVRDEFFIAHAVGWLIKTLMLRDVKLALFCSVLFETLELSLRHILPNFYECWWDHLILDIVITNGLGIYCGYRALRYLEMKQYDWVGISKISSYRGKVVRVLGQLTPESWTQFHWGIFSSWKRFLYFVFLVFMTEMVELGVFSLKALLWIPPPHPIVMLRLALMSFVVAPALREYYQFMIDPSVHVFGPNAWICCAITVLELLITWKWTRGLPRPPTPPLVKYGWLTVVAVVALFFVTYFPYREYVRRSVLAKEKPLTTVKSPQAHHHQKRKKTK